MTTATHLRKNLFHTLDQAVQGQTIFILYKGVRLQLTAVEGESKLARAVTRNALVVDPDSIVASDASLMHELDAKWSDEDKSL